MSFADLYPSSISEWQPIQSLAGIIDVIHSDIGLLQYKHRPLKSLLDSGIFFYDSLYIPCKNGLNGKLETLPLPHFLREEWVPPDSTIAESFRSKFFMDIQNCMKCSTGSKTNRLYWYLPFAIFVDFFARCNVRKTATMFIAKDLTDEIISELLDDHWDVKTDGNIQCRANKSSMIFRYHIEKQMLSFMFYYRRWIRDNNEWKALDQDFTVNHQEQMQIEVKQNEVVIATIEVEEDWSLKYIRSELTMLQFDIPQSYGFRVNGRMVRFCIK